MSDAPKSPQRRAARQSRYVKAQIRRDAQKQSDARFYKGMFSLMGVIVMVALVVAALAMNGGNVDVSGMSSWTTPWLGPLTKLEAAGLLIVAVIGAIMYRRMSKRK